MKVLHVSAECYPAAKSGGLGDVAGALPKYLCQSGVDTNVIMPKYNLKWLNNQEYQIIYKSSVHLGVYPIDFTVEVCANKTLGFTLLVVNCPSFFSKGNVYVDDYGNGFPDEVQRWLTFQRAVLQFVMALKEDDRPKILHCHDHHAGLIPFMLQNCNQFDSIKNIPTVFTIHNGLYQGIFSWGKKHFIPECRWGSLNLLDWNGQINPMASALKCAWRVTTVSTGYLHELRTNFNGLQNLLKEEWHKSFGILNGIDNKVWNPSTDDMLQTKLNGDTEAYKAANKKYLTDLFAIRNDVPLFVFIGRLVPEKGAELIPQLIGRVLSQGAAASFVVLGTGEKHIEDDFKNVAHYFKNNVGAAITYNEALSHQIYAGADFILMPSRVEPCGLNQMYSMRYGTIPIVRKTGGLSDTVTDFASPQGGTGINFLHFDINDAELAFNRASQLYWDFPERFKSLRQYIMQVDHSWENSTSLYIQLYRQIANV